MYLVIRRGWNTSDGLANTVGVDSVQPHWITTHRAHHRLGYRPHKCVRCAPLNSYRTPYLIVLISKLHIGKQIIIVNTAQAATDLFEKK